MHKFNLPTHMLNCIRVIRQLKYHKMRRFLMSFYINNTNPNRPGPICGNPMNGICEKVLIETTKVFDACVTQTTETGIILPVTGFNPPTPTLPLTFISATNQIGSDVVVSDIVIDRLDSTSNYANVSMNITIPLTVTYRDANGVIGTGTSSITVAKSAVLFVPQPSLTPVDIKVTAIFNSSIGTFTPDSSFTVTGCLQIVVKVTAVVDILVPSYGYPVIPPCQACPSCNACPGLSDLPLYPTASQINRF